MERTLFDRSVQTLALMDRLRETPIGSVVTYEALSNTLGQRLQDHRHFLYSALKALTIEGFVFGTVRMIGLKRLEAVEVPAIGDHAIIHIRRTSKKARSRMRVIDRMNDVDNSTRIRINTASSLLGVIEHYASSPVKRQAEKAATDGIVPPAKLIDALREK